jgi:TadE-like protein
LGTAHFPARHRRERGAAVVEFALVLPLLVTMLFGAIDFGFVSNDSTKLRQVVRETGRRASVWRFGRSLCDDSTSADTRWKLTGNRALGGIAGSYTQAMAAAVDDPAVVPLPENRGSRLGEARKLQCQLKLLGHEAGLDVRSKILVAAFPAVHTGIVATTTPTGFVFDKQNADPLVAAPDVSYSVVICAQYRTSSRTGLFGPLLNQKVLRSVVSMRVTRLNAPPKFYPGAIEEDPFTIDGKPGNWDGCTATPT